MNGDSVKLDQLGPMVVNTDGSLSRISNWHSMSDIEKERYYSIVLVRNEARLKALREKRAAEESAAPATATAAPAIGSATVGSTDGASGTVGGAGSGS